MNIHQQEISTKSYFVNRFGKLSTSYLFWQIQDIAWEHAEMLGVGFDNLAGKTVLGTFNRTSRN